MKLGIFLIMLGIITILGRFSIIANSIRIGNPFYVGFWEALFSFAFGGILLYCGIWRIKKHKRVRVS